MQVFTKQRVITSVFVLVLAMAGAYYGSLFSGAKQKSHSEISSQSRKNAQNFTPTASEWATLTIEPVKARSFRAEYVTEGKVAVDEDRSTPVFSPYAGRVTKLLAKPGETLKQGQPLFTIEAADTVQAQNDFITAITSHNKAKSATAFSAKTPKGRFIHYGIREHGMAAAMNGIFLHGGFAPNGATFLVFTDYARPAMRLAALMGAGVVYVMTHDSIGLGEDGPTHQPVEHLSALRAIPNMRVFRPCDAMEVAECWELALNRIDGPTVLALTRQNLPQLRTAATNENPCQYGAYELVAAQGEAKATLFASGSEVEMAVAAQKQLAERGIPTRVVSVPSLELLLAQPKERRDAIIGNAPVKVAIEAAVRWGWDAVIGQDGEFIGMHSFGASAPLNKIFQHFGITAEAAVNAVLKRVS